MSTTPKPGSHIAKYRGCTCDMIQNQFGLGVGTAMGTSMFIINPGCPLHEHGISYHGEPTQGSPIERPRVQRKGDSAVRNTPAGRRWREILFQGSSFLGRDGRRFQGGNSID